MADEREVFEISRIDTAVESVCDDSDSGTPILQLITGFGDSTDVEDRPGFSILLGVDNLLGDQRGEPDPLIVVPGRAFSVGLRANF